MPYVLSILKKLVNVKTLSFILSIFFLLLTLVYLNNKVNTLEQKAKEKEELLQRVINENERQVLNTQIKQELESKAKVRSENLQSTLQELKEQIQKRKDTVNAKNKEPPNSSFTYMQF